jgi:uncharacterized phage-associated protein
MNTCFDVANYFLKRQVPEAGDLMSNLKLQKLVYYAQGFYLAMTDSPLFNERIEAWEHGPVCVPLYHQYKEFGADAIQIPYDVNAYDIFTEKAREILDMVHRYYGQFSAWKLRNLTHEDIPWINAYRKGQCTEITQDAMRDYFKTQLVDNEGDK